MIKAQLQLLFSAAGLTCFFLFGQIEPFLLILFSALIIFILFFKKRNDLVSIIFPFALGLILPILKKFSYWDQTDFFIRSRYLLLLALLLTIFKINTKLLIVDRFLKFFDHLSTRQKSLLIFLVAEIFFIYGAYQLTVSGAGLSGDEPHYYLLTYSLARDGDLDVSNQYLQKQFKEFLHTENLGIHGYAGKKAGKIYSMHLFGLPLTLLPVYWLKLSPPVLLIFLRSYIGLFGAISAVLIFLLLNRFFPHKSSNLFLTILFIVGAPTMLHSIHLYPDIQILFLLLLALYFIFCLSGSELKRYLLASIPLGMAIFWGVKFALPAGLIIVGIIFTLLKEKKLKTALLFLLFPLFFLTLFSSYLYNAYGSFSPSAVYTGIMNTEQQKAYLYTILHTITQKMRLETLLNYLFDQRDGLLFYNPVCFFFLSGIILALKNFRRYRQILAIMIPAVIYIFNYAFLTQRGGYSPQARPLTAVFFLFIFALAIFFEETKNQLLRKALPLLIIIVGLISLYQLAHPETIYQPTTHDFQFRSGLLFQHFSNLQLDLPKLLPSFVKINNDNYLPNYIWLMIFTLVTLLGLLHLSENKIIFKSAIYLLIAAFLYQFVLFPAPPLYNPIQVVKSGSLPHAILGVAHWPAEVSERNFVFSRNETRRLIIATRRPTTTFGIQLETEIPPNIELNFAIKNFDQRFNLRSLKNQKKQLFYLLQITGKRVKNNYLYQFEISLQSDKKLFTPLSLQIFPLKK